MQRDHRTSALLLKSESLGEQHRLGTFLSADLGLFRAALFGARSLNSKLGAMAVPFQHLELWLYHQPVKNYWKVNDARPIGDWDGLRQDLDRYFAACLWAELALFSHAEGDWGASYRLMAESLTLLNSWPGTEVRMLNIQFCLRWVTFLGFPLDESSPNRYKTAEKSLLKVDDSTLSGLVHSPLGDYEPIQDLGLVEEGIFRYLEEVMGRPLLTLKTWRATRSGRQFGPQRDS